MRPEKLEQLFKTIDERRRFSIGIPQSRFGVPTLVTPEGVSILVSQGYTVKVEKGAGTPIRYDDARYGSSGAEVVGRRETLTCDAVIYGGALQPDEISLLRPHAVLLTLMRHNRPNAETVRLLLERRITVLALDGVRDRRGMLPLSDILDEVEGRAAIAAATSLTANPRIGKGILPGGVAGINPCEIVILGTGMASLAAARSVIGLGGMVRLFESDPYCLRTAMSELGPAVIGSALHPGVLGNALAHADVVIATRMERRFSVGDSVVDRMKKGVIVFDLDDRSGFSALFPGLRCVNTATALADNIEPGSNICLIRPSEIVPRTVAMASTNDIVPVVERLFGFGGGIMNALKSDPGLRASALLFRGHIVSRDIASALNVKWIDIDLLLSFS